MRQLSWQWLIVALSLWLAGCRTRMTAPGLADDFGGGGSIGCVDRDGDGYGLGCALGNDCDDTSAVVTNQCYVCAHDEPGCPCTTEGARASCGKITAQIGDQTTCGYGESVCSNGKWGDCVLDGRSTRSFSSSRSALGLAPPTACTENICDPYCKQYPDTPDNSFTTHTGIIGTDAGLTVEQVDGNVAINSDGPMPDRIKAQLTDAGLYPDAAPDAIVYHEISPGATAADTVTATATVRSLDVYLMDLTTAKVGAEEQLWFDMDEPGNVMDQIRAAVPDTFFGLGRYEQYDSSAWNTSGHPTVAYEHVQSMTNNPSQIVDALDWIHSTVWNTGTAAPTSWVDALFASATTGGLRGAGGGFWVYPRSQWVSPASGESGPCPLGLVGYPCFRPWALPVTVLFAQSPANNGPGGQYAYARNSTYGISGAALWPTPQAVTGNYTESTARSLDPIGQFAAYTGSTTAGMTNQSWQWNAYDDCPNGRGTTAPNVFFKFHASQRTSYHFDTVGSNFDTVLYMYTAADQPIACNTQHFFGANPSAMPSSLDGVVDPGDYFLVVDGPNGANGTYVLHVNAMPDGAATGPVAEPNYDEAIAAFNALGGKLVSVDASGYTCDHGPTAFVQRNTGGQLVQWAADTSSVNSAGAPYRVLTHPVDRICHAGDPPLPQQLAQAVIGTFNTVATSRMDVTAVAVDVDDSIDFDGPPGGRTILTPVNIDDATFVQSITTVATPETNTRCQQTLANRFVGCQPGTKVTFNVTFAVPANVPTLTHDQIFTFVIRTLRNGTLVLGETPVVIVVPNIPPRYVDGWFVRDYDTTSACPKGTAPLWGLFGWNSHTPGDSHIDFDVAVAPSLAELGEAPVDPLIFSNLPATLVGQAIGAQIREGGPDTERGSTLVDSTLAVNMRPRDSQAMRLRAHLVPSTDRTLPPVLQLWNQQISCQPAE